MKVCVQGEGRWVEEFVEGEDPRGQNYYWLTGRFASNDQRAEADISVLKEGFISIVPSLHDMTHHSSIPNLKALEVIK